MLYSFSIVKDSVEFLSAIVTIFSLSGIIIAYLSSRKQIYFDAIQKCTNDFRNLINKRHTTDEDIFLKNYIELVNEELFYIENNYLPKDVAIEWIDGMIDFLPFIIGEEIVPSAVFSNIQNLKQIKEKFRGYTRIYRFLHITSNVDFNKIFLPLGNEENEKIRINERAKLIKNLLWNLKLNDYDKICFRYRLIDFVK